MRIFYKIGSAPIVVMVLGSATAMRIRIARIKTQKSLTLNLSTVYKLWTLHSKQPIKNNQNNIHNMLYLIEI